MTPDDMRATAQECYEYMDARLVNKIVATLWTCTAEICERLDRAHEARKEDSRDARPKGA